ncbi:3D domain-containing protein [Candidatus Formimonas warabiya]|nr:3D domain-containing protein [Candidatus Formimonas warabiya]
MFFCQGEPAPIEAPGQAMPVQQVAATDKIVRGLSKEKVLPPVKAVEKKQVAVWEKAQEKNTPEPKKNENAAKAKREPEATNVSRHREYGTAQIFEATAYCSCKKCCGKSDGITKSGVKVHKGTLAVDPKVIPLGTKVYIEGMGWFVAEDTGNFRGNRIDIYMETHEKALQFGRKNVKVIL